MKKYKKIIISALCLIFLCFTAYMIFTLYRISNIPIYQTKDYNSIYIDNAKILADYRIFENVPKEYSALEQISAKERKKLAEYMRENDFVLSDGEQEFDRIHDKFEINVSNFKFMPRKSLIPNPDIHLDTENSYFSSFALNGQKVYYKCCLFIENSGEEKNIEITSFDRKNAVSGLLYTPDLCGIDPDTLAKTTYTLKNGENIIDVTFMGSQGTGTQKADRLLPEKIYIYEVN